jgi:GT2 family glycosyltransferase
VADYGGVEPSVRHVVAVVPVCLAGPAQVEPTMRTLVSLWATAPGIRAIVVDDASPEPALLEQIVVACHELGFEVVRNGTAQGRAAAINVGLQAALETGADALIVDPTIEFDSPGWLELLRARTDSRGRPAAVAGPQLLQAHGLIAEAGLYFSLLQRSFLRRYENSPAGLPAAQVPTACPLSDHVQLIRHETLAAAGLYDPAFTAGHGDADYSLRVFLAGLECVYEPAATAVRMGGPVADFVRDAAWAADSSVALRKKHATTDLSPFIPEIL